MKNIHLIYILAAFLFTINACQQKKEIIQTDLTEIAENLDIINISQDQFVRSGYEISKIETKDFPLELHVNGHLDIPRKDHFTISSYVGGIIQGLDLIEGEFVRKGQPLFTLSSTDIITLQQEYLQLRSEMDFLNDEVARQKLLADENISASKNYTKAKYEQAIGSAKLAGLQKNLQLIGINASALTIDRIVDKLTFTAPNNGYVDLLQINNGGYLPASVRALDIYSMRGLHLELKVLESDIAKVNIGQAIEYTISSFPGSVFKTTIELIEKFVDERGMVNVHCVVLPKDIPLLSDGMVVNATIRIDHSAQQALPEEAIVMLGKVHYILIQSTDDPTKFAKHRVILGTNYRGYTQVTNAEDLPVEANVLTKGAYYVLLEQ